MCHRAWMISAPSTASGSDSNSGVRKSRVRIVASQATRFDAWLLAPAPSLTALPDIPPAAIMPPKKELTMLVAAWAFSSWSASTS